MLSPRLLGVSCDVSLACRVNSFVKASDPEGFPPAELVVLHDPEAEKSLVIIILENEDDYRKADEILSAMPAGDTPGQRTSVTKYNVATRMKP